MTTENKDLATTENTGLAATGNTDIDTFDDLVAYAGQGTENIRAKDVRPPRLMMCQSGSPQRKEGNEKFITGLNELDLFNSLSGEIYGREISFAVVMMLGTHFVEFDKDLQVVDRDVPEDDPRAQWTENKDGERVKPVATQFYDYLVWLVEHNELVAMSFKSTQVKNAIKLNGLLKLPLKTAGRIIPNPPAWARVYHVKTEMQHDKNYSWGGYNLNTQGTTPPATRQLCIEAAKMFVGKTIVVERDADDVDQPVAGDAASETAGDATDM